MGPVELAVGPHDVAKQHVRRPQRLDGALEAVAEREVQNRLAGVLGHPRVAEHLLGGGPQGHLGVEVKPRVFVAQTGFLGAQPAAREHLLDRVAAALALDIAEDQSRRQATAGARTPVGSRELARPSHTLSIGSDRPDLSARRAHRRPFPSGDPG